MGCVKGYIVSGLSLYYIVSGLCEGMVCVKGWFVWRDGLCEGIDQTQSIPSHKPSLHTSHPSLYTKPSLQTERRKCFVCKEVFVWRDGLCEGMVCVKWWFVWRDGLCEGMVCVKGWIVWRMDCVKGWLIILSITSVHTNQIICNTEKEKWFSWRDGLSEGMVCVKGCNTENPSLHTNQLICNTENDNWFEWRDEWCLVSVKGWFLWRDGLCEKQPFKPFILLSMAYCLLCVKAWTVWLVSIRSHKPDNM